MRTKLFTALAIGVLGFSACSSDDDNTNVTPTPEEVTVLKGSITSNLSVKAGTVTLDGPTIVQEGATLTIPAGTKIIAKDRGSYLLIAKGAKINAKGTATSPITFTSNDAKPGAWGGLIINGKAPLSRAHESDPSTFGTEINDQIQYGGSDVADNSGELNYIVIEYSGANISDDKEHNGLTLNGVGNGTKIENIYVVKSADDGIEFFGGTVNVTNLLVVDSEDDMFDFTQGYAGTLKNAYGVWSTGFTTDEVDPRGIEADGNHDGNGPSHVNQSNFKIQDMTIVHRATGAFMEDVVKIRRGANAAVSNLLIDIAPNALLSGDRKQADGTTKTVVTDMIDYTDGKGDGSATISYTLLPASLTSKINPIGAAGITKNTSSTGANTTAFAWTKYNF